MDCPHRTDRFRHRHPAQSTAIVPYVRLDTSPTRQKLKAARGCIARGRSTTHKVVGDELPRDWRMEIEDWNPGPLRLKDRNLQLLVSCIRV